MVGQENLYGDADDDDMNNHDDVDLRMMRLMRALVKTMLIGTMFIYDVFEEYADAHDDADEVSSSFVRS